MNSNHQRFWMIADEADWITSDNTVRVDYDNEKRRIRLRSNRPQVTLPGELDEVGLGMLLNQSSIATDAYGTIAFWNMKEKSVVANGALGNKGSPVCLCGPFEGVVACDLTIGYDDVLYISLLETNGLKRNFIRFLDRRGRWTTPAEALPGSTGIDLNLKSLHADRLANDPSGGVWVLDRDKKKIGRVTGYPLADHLPGSFEPTVFRPVEENPNPPSMVEEKLTVADDETLVAIACSPDGLLALLSWTGSGDTFLRLREKNGLWRPADILVNAGKPASLAWLSNNQFAIIPGLRKPVLKRDEAVIFDLEYSLQEKRFKPVAAGGYYPLISISQRLFASGVTLPPQYPDTTGSTTKLLPLSVASYHESGEVRARVLDSGKDSITWHRLYLEAIIPQGCGLIVKMAATNDPQPSENSLQWHDHYFGDTDNGIAADVAHGVWLTESSEIPHHAGLLGCKPVQNICGLFTVLIQRPGLKVRSLSGRYLHMRIILQGRGYLTPEIAAVRVYSPRFSYRDNYLPDLYGEELFGTDADTSGSATRADFLGRFLDLFEGILTPLEDRVAAAQILMEPRSTPPEALGWLGSWLGIVFEPGFPVQRRRAWIEASSRLYRAHGTLAGLQLALEIATGGRLIRQFVNGRELVFPKGGAVTGGRVLVIEDFRLRRTFASILGADLSVENDPLLPGALLSSANSFIGDTLILGDESKKEFLSLFSHAFSNDTKQKAEEEDAVFDLYDKLANRVTILVHNEISPVDLGLLRRIVAKETPAHIQSRVVNATWPLIVGLSSLIEIDTFLTPHLPRGVARTDESRLGENAFIQRVPSLDPRLTY